MGIISHFPGGSAGGGTGMPEYTYTGNASLIDDGNGNWRIKFLTSGVLTFTKLGSAKGGVDVFCVGGGGGGAVKGYGNDVCGGGGGSGYTLTASALSVVRGATYQIIIGSGGTAGVDGGNTEALTKSAEGGKQGKSFSTGGKGGDGASGGGSAGNAKTAGGDGGSDGSNGSGGGATNGTGQGTTTREFGETTGDLYAGGGAGQGTYTAGAAGDGGGGASGAAGTDNLGGGGGFNAAGGSGIVIIRNHRG